MWRAGGTWARGGSAGVVFCRGWLGLPWAARGSEVCRSSVRRSWEKGKQGCSMAARERNLGTGLGCMQEAQGRIRRRAADSGGGDGVDVAKENKMWLQSQGGYTATQAMGRSGAGVLGQRRGSSGI